MTIAAFIREDLKARILSGSGMPARLTLEDLSRQYGTSLTPVRRAVAELQRERLLRRDERGRLSLPERAAAPRGRPARAAVPPQALESALARDLMKRSLEGKGEFLREEATAARYGIGRTQLRRLFSRLAVAGMLEHVARRGWRVRPFLEEDVDAYLQVREMLELAALEGARPRLRREDLERLLRENVCAGGAPHVDGELHSYLVEKSGNRYVQEFFARHGAYFTTLFYYAAEGGALVAEMARQHRRILEAMLAGRWERARGALSEHIRAQRPALRRMRRRLAAMPVERWPEIPT